MPLKVPFIQNTDDDLHCVQAAYMSILRSFKPDFDISWEEWNRITGFEKGKGTWPLAGLIWFKEHGFSVKHIELFNFNEFGMDGENYMRKRYPKDLAEWAIDHTNITAETQRAKKLQTYNICENRVPSIEDIKKSLDNGSLVRVHVNSRKLNRKEGYFGHALVIFDYDSLCFTLHDPGLPPFPNRKVNFTDFMDAWGDGDPSSCEMDSIKLS